MVATANGLRMRKVSIKKINSGANWKAAWPKMIVEWQSLFLNIPLDFLPKYLDFVIRLKPISNILFFRFSSWKWIRRNPTK